MSLSIRRMQSAHAEQLTTVAHAAKRHWDYPAAMIEQWKEELTLTPEAIEALLVFGALKGEKIIGFYALSGAGPARELEHLWVLPEHIGQGIGRTLFRHALRRITEEGASTLRIVSDPHAEGFYKRMGAQRIGEVPSVPAGRMLPLLELKMEEGATV